MKKLRAITFGRDKRTYLQVNIENTSFGSSLDDEPLPFNHDHNKKVHNALSFHNDFQLKGIGNSFDI